MTAQRGGQNGGRVEGLTRRERPPPTGGHGMAGAVGGVGGLSTASAIFCFCPARGGSHCCSSLR